MRDERAVEAAEGGGRALCATGVDVDGAVVAFILADALETLDYVSNSCEWYLRLFALDV